jgi:uncharacterized protein
MGAPSASHPAKDESAPTSPHPTGVAGHLPPQGGKDSGLYVGEVTHQRSQTFSHRLRYRLWMVLADLDELVGLQDRLWLLRRRFGPITLRTADHGDQSGRPLRVQVEAHLAGAGIDIAGGPIRLLTMPRILGYGFNPISVFFCHRPDGGLAALLYEVSNTFGERHTYLIAVPAEVAGPVRQTTDKTFFVSPFMDMGLSYDFTVRPPGEAVSIVVAVRRGDTPILTASFAGSRRPLTDGQLLRAFVTHPLLTWKVTLGIHWEAVKMMIKGARYRHRGPAPKTPVTLGHARS